MNHCRSSHAITTSAGQGWPRPCHRHVVFAMDYALLQPVARPELEHELELEVECARPPLARSRLRFARVLLCARAARGRPYRSMAHASRRSAASPRKGRTSLPSLDVAGPIQGVGTVASPGFSPWASPPPSSHGLSCRTRARQVIFAGLSRLHGMEFRATRSASKSVPHTALAVLPQGRFSSSAGNGEGVVCTPIGSASVRVTEPGSGT